MSDAPTVLKKILARKQQEIAERSAQLYISQLQAKIAKLDQSYQPRGFVRGLSNKLAQQQSAVIAEVKKASPSKGIIFADFDPVAIAMSYQRAGAACVSVLTDADFFQGHEDYLLAARAAIELPVIRKDFLIDDYQIYESRALGADCVLLIVAAFLQQPERLYQLYQLAQDLGMDVLVEVHDQAELEIALKLDLALLGINNRNLHTFETSLDNTLSLLPMIDENIIVVTESGIHQPSDVSLMRDHKVNSFLVGEAFMRQTDPGAALQELFYANV